MSGNPDAHPRASTHGHPHEPDHGHPHGGPHHEHDHPHGGVRGFLHHLFTPHSHDTADSIDNALEASSQGIRAVKISLVVLMVTAVAQLVIVWMSGSVALLADTIHNFSDVLTAVPLWIAFVLGRRAANSRYTYGYGRAEDLAGLFIVAMIALSAVVAGVESIRRIADPQPLENLGWVLAAGVVGFAGNEAVAVYRIRTGRRIGSAALVADGVHARTDGFTSLAVVLGVIGVWLGFPMADPIIGLLITAAILVLLWGTARDVGRRLLDGVDPDLTDRARAALEHVTAGAATGAGQDAAESPLGGGSPAAADAVRDLRLRWTGHRLHVDATLAADPAASVTDAHRLAADAEEHLRAALPAVGSVHVAVTSVTAVTAVTS